MYHNKIFQSVLDFIKNLPQDDQGKIRIAFDALECNRLDSVYIKSVRTPIRELIIKKYRILFFIERERIYFLHIFIKKTTKTPKREIEKALQIYKLMK